ncbi:NAD(P)H-dependent oxidoreductase [Achromobacter aloeverae]|nr:NAD(P)H-dependent oxidoreductase [Achromobacter aloeverae]
MAQAAAEGARGVAEWAAREQSPPSPPGDALHIALMPADDVQAADLLRSEGYLFCAPENLGSLSGAMKECFDRCYYGVLDTDGASPVSGRPYGLMVSAGTDGSGAARQMERICTGWRLRLAAPPLIARNGAQTPAAILAPKTVAPEILRECRELGGLLAGLLLMAG